MKENKISQFKSLNQAYVESTSQECIQIVDKELRERRQKKVRVSKYLIDYSDAVLTASTIQKLDKQLAKLFALKPKYICVSHEGKASGAPIVLKNLIEHLDEDTLVISFGVNKIFKESDRTVVLNFQDSQKRSAQWGYMLGHYLRQKQPSFNNAEIIGSTIESSFFVQGLQIALDSSSTLLLHEHASCYGAARLEHFLATFDKIIYSSDYVKTSYAKLGEKNNWLISFDHWHKLPQPLQSSYQPSSVKKKDKHGKTFVIIGCGHAQPRKGLHIFVNIVSIVAEYFKSLNIEVHARWIGMPSRKDSYISYVQSLVNEASSSHDNLRFDLMQTCDEYMSYVLASDLFLCTSTIDPLPNIVFDSISLSVPTVILKSKNGHEEYYRKFDLNCLVLDTESLRHDVLDMLQILRDADKCHAVVQCSTNYLRSLPSKKEYALQVKECSKFATALAKGKRLLSHLPGPEFSSTYYKTIKSRWLGFLHDDNRVLELCTKFHATKLSHGHRNRWVDPSEGLSGFRQVLTRLHGSFGQQELSASLVTDYNDISRHMMILRPCQTSSVDNIDYTVHLHAHYLDECIRILNILSSSTFRPTCIVITSSSKDILDYLGSLEFLSTELVVVPCQNVGRNILPILSVEEHVKTPFFVHLHTKKSLHTESRIIEKWVNFLLATLMGDANNGCQSLAMHLQSMRENNVDLAYPFDPNSQYLGANAAGMQDLMHAYLDQCKNRSDIKPIFSKYWQIPYPCGFMFICSSDFLRSTLIPAINCIEHSQLSEPLAYDATPLHAVERLTPILAAINNHKVGLIKPGPMVVR